MNASALFAQACAHDSRGEEAEAIPFYERALAEGLSGEERFGAFVGLGSSLRNVGRLEDAATVLERGLTQSPGDPALSAFLALVRHDQRRHGDAMRLLLKTVIEHAPVGQYRRALTQYSGLLPD